MSETTKRVVHNVVAHPLLVLWPRVGEWLHERTAPGEETEVCEGCRCRYVTHWDAEGVPLCDECWADLVAETEVQS